MEDIDDILNLLDDADSEVRFMVDKYIINKGQIFLDLVKQSLGRVRTKKNANFLKERMQVLVELFAAKTFTDNDPWLDLGIYCLNSIYNPMLVKEDLDRQCFAVVSDVLGEINKQLTAVEQTTIFNHIFFHRFGFEIADSEYDGFCIPSVYDVFLRRKGSFTMIAVAYLLVAKLAGMPIYPVGLPDKTYALVYFEKGKPLLLLAEKDGEIKIIPVNASILSHASVTSFTADKTTLGIYCEYLIDYYMDNPDSSRSRILSQIYKSL